LGITEDGDFDIVQSVHAGDSLQRTVLGVKNKNSPGATGINAGSDFLNTRYFVEG
jgi:hypothetical protein